MTGSELKPVRCGCGGEAKVVKALCNDKKGKPIVVGYSVTCEICGTRTRPVSAGAIAVAVWNKAMGAYGRTEYFEEDDDE